MQAIGSISKGNQQAQQLEAQARINDYNAALAAQRAESVRSVYSSREDQARRRQRLFLGRQRAGAAESRTGLGGTNADLLHQSEVEAEFESLNIRYEGDLEARGLLAQADTFRTQATNARRAAKGAKMGGLLGAGAAAISGYGSYSGAGTTPTTTPPGGNRLIMDYNGGMYPYG